MADDPRIDPYPRRRVPSEFRPRPGVGWNHEEATIAINVRKLYPEKRHLPRPPLRQESYKDSIVYNTIEVTINTHFFSNSPIGQTLRYSIAIEKLAEGLIFQDLRDELSESRQATRDQVLDRLYRLTKEDFQANKRNISMASSEVDMKFLGNFARNIQADQPLLSQSLFQILGNITMFSEKVIRARKLRRLDTTRDTKSVDLYCRIIWYTRECLKILEEYVLPMVAKTVELKVLAYKLRASFYHLYVLFHNQPPVSLKVSQVHTPPGLKSPRVAKVDKGKGIDRGSPSDPYRPSSVQPTHPLEGGPVGGVPTESQPPLEFAPNFLVPAGDFRPLALNCFQEASSLSDSLLWGSHPLRLSVKVEFTAFLYDCLHERDRSRQLAKTTISEVYNAKEGMDDEMFEDAAHLVGILGKMMKRGLGSGGSGSTPGAGSSGNRTTPPKQRAGPDFRVAQYAVPSPGMDNPI